MLSSHLNVYRAFHRDDCWQKCKLASCLKKDCSLSIPCLQQWHNTFSMLVQKFRLYSLMWYLHLLSNLLLCVCACVPWKCVLWHCGWWWQLKSRETVSAKMEFRWIMSSVRFWIMVWYNIGLASSLVLHKVVSGLFWIYWDFKNWTSVAGSPIYGIIQTTVYFFLCFTHHKWEITDFSVVTIMLYGHW